MRQQVSGFKCQTQNASATINATAIVCVSNAVLTGLAGKSRTMCHSRIASASAGNFSGPHNQPRNQSSAIPKIIFSSSFDTPA